MNTHKTGGDPDDGAREALGRETGWPAWRRRLTLLAIALPVALLMPPIIADHWQLPFRVGLIPFALLFCGCSAALWIFGVRPDVLALPPAFAAAFFYFTPAAYVFLSGQDGFRVVLVLGVLFAPIWMAWRFHEPQASWQAAHLPTLDGWRAIAILLVMIDHMQRGLAADHHMAPPGLFLFGQEGVNVFFAISGLLITWKLLEEGQQTGSISLRHFYCRRIYRIFPAACVFLTVMASLSVAGYLPATRLDFVSTVLYFRNFVPVVWPSFSNAHFWSLSLEEQFYLFLPATLLWLGRRRFGWLGVAMVTICATWRWYYFQFMAGPDPAVSTRFRTDLRIDGLLCGSLMAMALQNQQVRSFVRKTLTTPAWLVLLAVFAALAHWGGVRTLFAESLILPLLLAGTMLAPQNVPARLLEWKPLRWIGRISYSLYLWQQFFFLCPVKFWLLQPLHRFPANIAATFAFASLSYYLLERPLVRRAHRQLSAANDLPLRMAATAAR